MTVLVKFELLPQNNKYEELKTFLSSILPDTSKYAGNEGVILSVDNEINNKLVLIEYWQSRAYFVEYLNWRVTKGDFDRLEAMLIGEMNCELFDVLDDCYFP